MIHLTIDHIKKVCKSGERSKSCCFMLVSTYGLLCAKGTSLEDRALNISGHLPVIDCEGATGIIGRF